MKIILQVRETNPTVKQIIEFLALNSLPPDLCRLETFSSSTLSLAFEGWNLNKEIQVPNTFPVKINDIEVQNGR